MLFLLREPATLLAVAVALLVGIVAHGVVQSAVARAVGDRMPAASGRLSPDPRRHFEPFGVIAMLLSGVGWNKPVPLQEPRFRGSRGRYAVAVLSGPVTNLVLSVLGLLVLKLLNERGFASTEGFSDFGDRATLGTVMAFEFALVNAAIGVLTLLPIPPLDGARLLWAYGPRSPGWQNARYQLEERNIGLGICVVGMLPLFGGAGLLLRLTFAIAAAFLDPIASAFGLAVV
ncbi:MAG TPA: site-2 protease family protein [Mycobacteriales bacterium]